MRVLLGLVGCFDLLGSNCRKHMRWYCLLFQCLLHLRLGIASSSQCGRGSWISGPIQICDAFSLKVVVFRNVRQTGSARMKTKEDIEHPANALHSYTFNAGREESVGDENVCCSASLARGVRTTVCNRLQWANVIFQLVICGNSQLMLDFPNMHVASHGFCICLFQSLFKCVCFLFEGPLLFEW